MTDVRDQNQLETTTMVTLNTTNRNTATTKKVTDHGMKEAPTRHSEEPQIDHQ